MALRKARPVTFKPKGLTDSIDSTNSFAGAMQSLQNLVPSPSTDDTWVPRPGAVQLSAFPGFTTPGFVSGLLVVGNIAYGMIPSGRNAAKDEPFPSTLLPNTFFTLPCILNPT